MPWTVTAPIGGKRNSRCGANQAGSSAEAALGQLVERVAEILLDVMAAA